MQKIGRNDPCWCGSGHKYKNCHMDFDVKLSEYRHKGSKVPSHAMIKNPEQIAAIRESAKINVSASQPSRSICGFTNRLLTEAEFRLP